jgi:hypothetical protein
MIMLGLRSFFEWEMSPNLLLSGGAATGALAGGLVAWIFLAIGRRLLRRF